MIFRFFITLFSLLFIPFSVLAVDCKAVFPGPQTFSAKGANVFFGSNTCNGSSNCVMHDFDPVVPFPIITSIDPFTQTNVSHGVYEHTNWNLPANAKVIFSGTGTAVLYFNGSITIPEKTRVNTSGKPENVLIIVNGSIEISQKAHINANIYATGSISVRDKAHINGAVSAAGSLVVDGNGKFIYDESYINNMDSQGFCKSSTPPIPISCSASLPAVAFSDNFSSASNGWKRRNFNRNISNWPNSNITNTNGEVTNVRFNISGGELSINGALTGNNDNEYGMVTYDLSLNKIDKGNVNNYAISSDITANKVGDNNDVGLIFGYRNNNNYYVARWNKFGSALAADNTYPGVYRRLELVKVSGGNASLLHSVDGFDENDPFNFEVVVNNQGTAVCVNDVAVLYSASEQPTLNDFGIFSYDNDVGVQVDNIEVRCDDCLLATPIASYRFDECSYNGVAGEVKDHIASFDAVTVGNVTSLDTGFIENGIDLLSAPPHIETNIPLPSAFSISTWFKKPTALSGNRYFVLGAMSSGGDLMYIDRGDSWHWGVYNAGSGTSINGTNFSFNSLDNNWHHMVLVHANNQTMLYIDGVHVDTVNIQASGTLKYIGTSFDQVSSSNSQGFRSALDEFMIFDGGLTQDQINQVYSNQSTKNNYDGTPRARVICEPLIGFYSFEQPSFSSGITDDSGLGNHGTNIGGSSTPNGKYCRAFEGNGTNNTDITRNAFSTNIDLDYDVSIKGTISFWFNSHTNWNQGGFNGGGERTLFDASLEQSGSVSDKYFTLGIQNNGRLRFTFEDSADGDFSLEEPSSSTRSADTWYYVSVTWDLENNHFQIYVDGNLVVQRNINTNGYLSDLGAIIFGDNASKYSANNNNSLASDTSANGKFDEVRIYSLVKSAAEIQADMIDTNCIALNHYQILHDGNGLTCDSERVTIKACSNPFDGTCNQVNENGSFTLNVAGANGNTTQAGTFVNGIGTVNFNYTFAEQVNLSLNSASPAPAQNTVCLNGAIQSCNMQFTDAGFRFYSTSDNNKVVNQISGKPSETLYMQAVEKNTATGLCQAALVGANDVELAAECENPSNCSVNVNANINNTDILTTNAGSNSLNGNLTPISLNFGNNNQSHAAFTLNYPDAGQIRLHAKYKLPNSANSYITGSSNSFVVSPFGFYLNFAPDGSNNTTNPAAINAGDAKFKKAGELFETTITAVQWQSGDSATNNNDLVNNPVTPNFGNEQLPASDNVNLSWGLVAPLPGSLGNLTNREFSDFVNGQATQNISWTEVGIISVTAALKTTTYLGANTVSTTAPYVGRFYPDHFEIDNVVNGDVFSTCEATNTPKSYTYVGEKTLANTSTGALGYGIEPKFSIIAKSANCPSGVCTTTENYVGAFDKLTVNDVNLVTPTQDYATQGADTLTNMALSATIDIPQMSNVNGEISYTFNSDDHYFYTHDANAKRAEFISDINLGITSITDNDNVTAIDFTSADDADFTEVLTLHPTGTTIRFGRWRTENAYGPETSDLIAPMAIEVFNGTQFITHVDDNCTVPQIASKQAAGALSLFDYRLIDQDNSDSLFVADTLATIPTALPLTSKKFNNGQFQQFVFSAPNNNKQGPLLFEYEVPPWLKYDWTDGNGPFTENPSALITFGLFRGNDRIISWREVGN